MLASKGIYKGDGDGVCSFRAEVVALGEVLECFREQFAILFLHPILYLSLKYQNRQYLSQNLCLKDLEVQWPEYRHPTLHSLQVYYQPEYKLYAQLQMYSRTGTSTVPHVGRLYARQEQNELASTIYQ